MSVLDTQDNAEKTFVDSATLFKALAHPVRLKVVCGLLSESATQTAIARRLGIPQSSLAQHLAVLRREGIVKGRRERGAEVILEVVDPRIPGLFSEVCGGKEFLEYGWGVTEEVATTGS